MQGSIDRNIELVPIQCWKKIITYSKSMCYLQQVYPAYHGFVCSPLQQISTDMTHPSTGLTISAKVNLVFLKSAKRRQRHFIMLFYTTLYLFTDRHGRKVKAAWLWVLQYILSLHICPRKWNTLWSVFSLFPTHIIMLQTPLGFYSLGFQLSRKLMLHYCRFLFSWFPPAPGNSQYTPLL